jgi:hypothetical protein
MREATSGREDLNLRPVAAATALPCAYKFISTAPGFEITLASRCFGSAGKAFAMNKDPRNSMFRSFGIASVMAANSLSQSLARAHVAPPSFFASQDVTVKHSAIHVGARGFEPPTSWSQTTRSTKLSYAPNMQRDCYHEFCSRASGERTRLACCDWRPRQSLFLFHVQCSSPNSARAVFPPRVGVRLAGSRNRLPDRVRSARSRNISNPDAKNRARSRWRRDASQTTPSV